MDGKHYAIKVVYQNLKFRIFLLNSVYTLQYDKRYEIRIQAFHKSQLLKLRVAPSETAMTDVLREVFI